MTRNVHYYQVWTLEDDSRGEWSVRGVTSRPGWGEGARVLAGTEISGLVSEVTFLFWRNWMIVPC